MRIHIYLREFPLDGDRFTSGVIKAVHGLAAGLARNGARVTVLCDGQRAGATETSYGYDVCSFEHSHSEGGSFSSIPRKLHSYIEEHNDGIYLLNGIFSPCVFAMSRACRKNGVPYVAAPHDPYHPTIFATRRLVKWTYWRLRERRMLRQASAVQVLDSRHSDWLRRLHVHTPTIEVLNGYAPDDVRPLDQLAWRTAGPPRLLYLGRMDLHNKGLDILLDAFAQLTDRTDAQLTLQGPDWGDKDTLVQRAAALGLNGRVEFLEPDYEQEAAIILAEHDVFLLPSRFEGFGLSALEAMLSGRPVLVSEVVGIAPHVRASGCGRVISADVEQVKQGVLELISLRSQWKQIGLAGREYALKNLTWDRIAAQTLGHYRTLLEASRTPVPIG